MLVGDSAGGGYALALAQALRDRGRATPTHLLLHAPWVDLTTSTPETAGRSSAGGPVAVPGQVARVRRVVGRLGRRPRPARGQPGLADLAGLPPALMFCGTRDTLMPGCRLLARRAAEAGWDLTYVEVPDLIHVFPLLPFIPEARRAWRQTLEFLR